MPLCVLTSPQSLCVEGEGSHVLWPPPAPAPAARLTAAGVVLPKFLRHFGSCFKIWVRFGESAF